MSRIALEDWMSAALEATFEVSTAVLGMEGTVLDRVAPQHRHFPGAYLGLTAPEESVQVGLVAPLDGLQAIAKAMLGMAPEDEALPASDLADAVGEFANIFAGGVKKRMLPRVGSLGLGLPLFINGFIEPTDKLIIHAVDVQLGSIPATLLIVREREAAR